MSSRVLNEGFLTELKRGFLEPILRRVHGDSTLDLQIRDDAINVYYRGGSLLKVQWRSGRYEFVFDRNYLRGAPEPTAHLPKQVSGGAECEQWVAAFPVLKDAMDRYMSRSAAEEAEIQQDIVRFNNYSTVAGGTDYFILDTEYVADTARYDLVGVEWLSESAQRKLQKGYRPALVLMELKNGAAAVSRKSGLASHLRDLRRLVEDPVESAALKTEMVKLLEQKRVLELIPGLTGKDNRVTELADQIQVMVLLANYDPASTKLAAELREIESDVGLRAFAEKVWTVRSNLLGYGLYANRRPQLLEGMKHAIEQGTR